MISEAQYARMKEHSRKVKEREDLAKMADNAFGRLFQQVENVELGNYDTNSQYLCTVRKIYRDEDWFSAYAFMFQYGFLKEQRCEKARQKKRKKAGMRSSKE